MNSSGGFFLAAGTVTLAANAKKAGGFPSNGWLTIFGTFGLLFLASVTDGTAIARPVKWIGIITLIAALSAYAPKLFTNSKPTRGAGRFSS